MSTLIWRLYWLIIIIESTQQSGIRLVRDGIIIHTGELGSLKRFKDDVKEVNSGYECGITLENFRDIKDNDILEAYTMEQIKPGK